MVNEYKDKQFKSISDEDMTEELSEEEKEAVKKAEEENKELLDFVKETLGSKVAEVTLSSRLADAAVCLTSKGGISLEMEKTINAMPTDEHISAEKVLEINPEHAVMKKLQDEFAHGPEGKEKAAAIARLLYDQAALVSGLAVEDPVQLSKDICSMIAQ